MGRKLHYRPGSFYRVDDRTGFPQRAERTRKEWTGFIVDEARWEARQPQDLVKGVPDYQAAPEPRPLAPNSFVGPIYTALDANAAVGATVLSVSSTAGFSAGQTVCVMLDNGCLFRTTQNGAAGAGTITLAAPLPYAASSGNMVLNEAKNPTNPLTPTGA